MGREGHCKHISLACGECAQCLGHTGFASADGVCAFPPSTLLRLQVALQGAGHVLRALPRPKLLRFRFSGTSERRRLSWACVLCPSQVRAAQVTRCLANALSPGGECVLSPPRSQPLGFLGGSVRTVSGVLCVSSGELISGCDPPGRCQPSRIPGSLG